MSAAFPPDVAPAGPDRARLLAAPEQLHPALWRARSGLAGAAAAGWSSGFPVLDAELPGGGWPRRALTELLLPRPGVGELRLLAPALARAMAQERGLMLFDPPAAVSAEALAQLGLPPAQCIVVRGRAAARPAARHQRLAAPDLDWALEQALRSGQVGAVLAWPTEPVRPELLRRLQLAAQAHEGPAFLIRELHARQRPSPAPLRLQLACAGPDRLSLQLLKRRGPALERPLLLTLAPVLSPRALARALAPQGPAADQVLPVLEPSLSAWLARLGTATSSTPAL